MMPFDRILFPVDFSEASEAMVGDVIALARRFDAAVTLLHAFNEVPDHHLAPRADAPFGPGPGEVPYTPALKELRKVRQERLEEIARERFAPAGIEARAVVEDGDPLLAIEWAAKQVQAQLVMLSSKGMGKLRRLLGASLPAKLLRDVDCPVYTSTHPGSEDPKSADGFRTILCALRTGPESEAALRIAAIVARAFGSRVCLLRVRSSDEERKTDEAAEGIGEAFRKATAEIGEGLMTAQVRNVDAETPDAVRQTAAEVAADLVVIGRGQARAAMSGIWSNLFTVISESPCPVLSV